MIEVGYDCNKLPLGKLSKTHVKKGYEVLQQIAEALEAGQRPALDLSNQFYTLVSGTSMHTLERILRCAGCCYWSCESCIGRHELP